MTRPAVIILAAGEGTRMKSRVPKVLHRAAGRSLLGHAIAAAEGVGPDQIVVVVRHGRDLVAAEAQRLAPGVLIADQDEIPGTGRAVQCALAALDGAGGGADGPGAGTEGADGTGGDGIGGLTEAETALGEIVVICSDTPLIDTGTLVALLEAHRADGNGVTLLSAVVDDPFGYGRVVRDPSGQVAEVVEERDAAPEQAKITEINAAAYVYSAAMLRTGLARLGNANSQGEVYLTDVVAVARAKGQAVRAIICEDAATVQGVNDRAQLAWAAGALNERIIHQAMVGGVSVIDPATTWIDADVELAADVTVMPGTHLAGQTVVAAGAVIGPFTTLTDTSVGAGATVDRTVANQAVIGDAAQVGPYTHLRPGTVLGRGSKAGSFTELKAAEVADGAKVPHLAYVGDASVGEGANVGAGTIFANYDGVTKSKCVIGPGVRIGSNNVVVAPVEMGAGSYSGAGTVVRGDVPPGSLAVSAGPQRVIEGWTLRKRPGSVSAAAAERALAEQVRAGQAAAGSSVAGPGVAGQAVVELAGPEPGRDVDADPGARPSTPPRTSSPN
ncbi:MAG: bifunctional UDP-N-acetylglucosamine diphosphorylase/glucosamine-1-phosphate N-acetyltransferase GlmU [Bifidobacteriaceae bacterium]|jgi:bifunctional UDP-N-acetylglucosamine pyrophosphorylase/glucosamine-1-phosphate N-acetyltransferase|nr:bifunctional UDP-N-acetylglucosamine diphosphorylase/glucosamine-1-phosphate N-acetyltransferase GlmU [Bifidobacteriaceae bacterium]